MEFMLTNFNNVTYLNKKLRSKLHYLLKDPRINVYECFKKITTLDVVKFLYRQLEHDNKHIMQEQHHVLQAFGLFIIMLSFKQHPVFFLVE